MITGGVIEISNKQINHAKEMASCFQLYNTTYMLESIYF